MNIDALMALLFQNLLAVKVIESSAFHVLELRIVDVVEFPGIHDHF